MRRTTCALLAALASAWACGACQKDEQILAGTSAEPSAVPAAPPPRDHLVPGELIEGPEVAFGLRLPRGSRVQSVFPQQIVAVCDAKAADVANYIRPRVSMGLVSVGAASTMFERVQVPVNPGHELVIRVEEASTGTGSRITLRDVTAPPLDPSLSDEQRWKQVGMTPGGHIVDPTHLH